MGLEVSRIFALAEGSFHIKNTKKATLGTRSTISQNRTLKQRSECEGDEIALSKNIFICRKKYISINVSEFKLFLFYIF